MKRFNFTLLAVLAFSSLSMAQSLCDGGRYSGNVFTNVTVTNDIVFGSNSSFTGATTSLKLDFYEPTGDTETKRPLIILAHGGSFQFGTSQDQDVSSLCNTFAKKGYACASINYRLGFFPLDSANAIKAVLRAVQDMKASVRFFYKDSKDGANVYKIDTNNIFIGGSSAGAITALHTAYLDKECELSDYMSTSVLNTMGGIDGNSGNAGYSMKVNGVINLCGALAKYGWLEAGDLPLCSMHGTNDATVKYNRGVVNPGVPLMYLDGSRMLDEHACATGISSSFFTWRGAPHVPYAGTGAAQLAYMDTTVKFIRDYLISRLGCDDAILQPENMPAETANLYSYTSCGTSFPAGVCLLSVENNEAANLIHLVYPNPSENEMNIAFADQNQSHQVELVDLAGRVVRSGKTTEGTFILRKEELKAGNYILRISNNRGEMSTQHVVFY